MNLMNKYFLALKKLGITMQAIESETTIVVELKTIQSRSSVNFGKAKKLFPAVWEGKKVEVKVPDASSQPAVPSVPHRLN